MKKFKHLPDKLHNQTVKAGLSILSIGSIGTILVLVSQAATPTASFEVESGTVTPPTTIIQDATASGGQTVKFGQTTGGGTGSSCDYPAYPDASCTGPLPDTVFKPLHTGNYEVKTSNVVLDGLRVNGAIVVEADNVTIKNCEVNATGELWGIAHVDGEGHNLVVQNCRVYGVPDKNDYEGTHVLLGVKADEIGFSDISGVENGIQCGKCYIHDNYIHDFPTWIPYDSHTDGLQTWGNPGVGGLRIIHNTIIGVVTSADYSPENYSAGSSAIALLEGMYDITIDKNFFAGGTYTMYGSSQGGSSPPDVRVTNNRFSTQYFPKVGMYGTHTGFNKTAPGFVWTGNVIHETGQTINP